MKLGDIVEFVHVRSKSKYFARVDGFFQGIGNLHVGGGIDSNCWLVKVSNGWHKGNSGYFPFAQCKSVKLCENKRILKKFR